MRSYPVDAMSLPESKCLVDAYGLNEHDVSFTGEHYFEISHPSF